MDELNYKIVSDVEVLNMLSNRTVHLHTRGGDYNLYMQWLAKGNTPLPKDAPDKSLALKKSENEYLMLLASLPIELSPSDTSDTIKQKLLDSGLDKVTVLEIAIEMLNAIHEVEIKGGSFYTLPSQLHVIEE